MSGFGRDKSRRVDFNGFQGSPMSGFGRGNRAVWIVMDLNDPPDAPAPGLNPHLAKSP